MEVRSLLYYEARITFGMATLLPLLLLPGYMVLGWLIWSSRQTVPQLYEGIRAFELLLTLSAGLGAAHLMSIEREEGFDEMRRTYAERTWRLPVLRSATAIGFLIGSGAFAAAVFHLAYGSYDLRDVVLPAFAPALYLAGLALLVNNVTGSYWVAAGVVAGYWYADLNTAGAYTGVLFLFNHAIPQPTLDPSVNRGLLVLGALVCFALTLAFSVWRRRGAVGR